MNFLNKLLFRTGSFGPLVIAVFFGIVVLVASVFTGQFRAPKATVDPVSAAKAALIDAIDAQKRPLLEEASGAEASGAAMQAQGEDFAVRAVQLKADAANARSWAASCRAANVLGTIDQAVDCSVIPAGDEEAGSGTELKVGPDWIKNGEPCGTGSVVDAARGQCVKVVSKADDFTGAVAPVPELIYELDRSDSNLTEVAARLIWRYNAAGYSQSPAGLTAEVADARAKQLLEAYGFDKRFGLTPGYGWEIFKKVGKRYGIKPEFLVCVAKADSSLGKNLKTDNNIGNVGNNDRGNRVHLPDIGSGIDHIGLTLTNKYLAYKQSIGSLTPVGGGTSPFYSTSQEGNWYNNVRNCLAEITNNPTVNADWAFRN